MIKFKEKLLTLSKGFEACANEEEQADFIFKLFPQYIDTRITEATPQKIERREIIEPCRGDLSGSDYMQISTTLKTPVEALAIYEGNLVKISTHIETDAEIKSRILSSPYSKFERFLFYLRKAYDMPYRCKYCHTNWQVIDKIGSDVNKLDSVVKLVLIDYLKHHNKKG